MASRLREFPKDEKESEAQYPWGQWLDGSVWKITKDSDFHIGLGGFMYKVYSEASKRDLIVRVKLQDSSVVVQAFTPDQINNNTTQLKSKTAKKRIAARKARVILDEQEIKELKKMKRMGYTNAEIAKHFGVSLSTVMNKLAA